MRIRNLRNRKHSRYVRQHNDDTVPFCKEQVLERHAETGLPILTECKFENGKTMQIHYKDDGSWVVDTIKYI
jgi:hypothetical protein